MKVKKDIPNYFLYRHIRPDTNEVFYVGKGNNLDTRLKPFRRAFLRSQRTMYWNNIVNKNNGIFDVDIFFECDTEREANIKEIEFILLYGRRDLNLGTLVNLSNGGEGVSGVIQRRETVEKRSGKNNYHYQGLMEKYKLEKNKRLEKRRVIDVDSKIIYKNITVAAISIGITPSLLSRYLKNDRPNKTSFCLYNNYLSSSYSVKQPRKKCRGSKKYVIDTETGVFYDSIRDAANYTLYAEVTVRKMISNRMVNKTNLKYA